MVESTSVVIPAFNEAASIGSLVTNLRAAGHWHEILVIDDGSTDETATRAAAAGARVVHHPYNKGNGAAVKSGIRRATGTCRSRRGGGRANRRSGSAPTASASC